MSCFPIQGVRKYKKVLGEAFKVSSSITQSWKHPKKKLSCVFQSRPTDLPTSQGLECTRSFLASGRCCVGGDLCEKPRRAVGCRRRNMPPFCRDCRRCPGSSSCLSGLSLQVLMCLLLCLWFDRMTSLMTWTAFLLQQRPWRKEAHIRSLWWQLTACYPLMPPGWLKSLPLMR